MTDVNLDITTNIDPFVAVTLHQELNLFDSICMIAEGLGTKNGITYTYEKDNILYICIQFLGQNNSENNRSVAYVIEEDTEMYVAHYTEDRSELTTFVNGRWFESYPHLLFEIKNQHEN